MTEHVRGYETRWLDPEIRPCTVSPRGRPRAIRPGATTYPAAGHLPAATDPTQMGPERLRTMLGL